MRVRKKRLDHPSDIVSFDNPETGEMLVTAHRLAQAFHRWHNLDVRLQNDPKSVSMEDVSAAWAEVLQAHEEWNLAR